jgi:putative Holliday junction resolvase
MEGRVLAVDPGSVNIGIAVSDTLRMAASPLTVVKHTSMEKDCQAISMICQEQQVTLVIIGQALGADGEMTAQSRHAQKLANLLANIVSVPILLWDESGSTQQAKLTQLKMGVKRKKRSGHLDAHAAAVILHDYLDIAVGRGSDEA